MDEQLKRTYYFTGGEPPESKWWYTEEQIKSACEWLIARIKQRRNYEDVDTFGLVDPIMIELDIKEAFKEVYKEERI